MAGEYGEPWLYLRGTTYDEIAAGDGSEDVCVWDHRGRSQPPSERHGNRVVACVNALDGISDPAAYMAWVARLEEAARFYRQNSTPHVAIRRGLPVKAQDVSGELDAALKEKP